MGGIEILCAAISGAVGEPGVVERTCFGCGERMFPLRCEGTAELHAVTVAFTPCAVEDHFESSLAQWGSMWAKRFWRLCVPRIDRYECSAFHAFNDQVVEFAHIIGGVGDKHCVFFEFVETFELFDECFCNRCIGFVAGKGEFDKRNALSRYNDVSAVAPEEFKPFAAVRSFLIAVIAQSCLGISPRFFLPSVVLRLGFLMLFSRVAAITGFESTANRSSVAIPRSTSILLTFS